MLTLIRRWTSSWPLQRRVSYLTTVAVALAVAISSLAGYFTLRISLYNALDHELVQVAQSLRVPVSQDLRSNFGGLTERSNRAGDISVAAIRSDGQTFFVPDESDHLFLRADELAIARLNTGYSARSGETNVQGVPYRIVAIPLDGLDSNYALVVGRPLEVTDTILNALSVVLFLFGLLGVLAARAAGATVARSSLRPVRDLNAAMQQVTRTRELTPIAVTSAGDIAQLTQSFNQMLTSLASSQERQRRLIADAGHELRTPLTSLRTNLELLTQDAKTGMLKEQDRAEIFSDVNGQLSEFTQLIGDLVQLARDEHSGQPEVLDFRNVVTSALNRARRRGHGLQFDVELSSFWVFGESDSLERAVTNLMDNAVKWSPPGGTVRIQLEGDRLRVADEGPGIAEADLPHVFDRFYRADTARNTPGTGLGLSIVAQTVAQHGGWVTAGRSAQGGAEFTLQLPGAKEPEDLVVPESPQRQSP